MTVSGAAVSESIPGISRSSLWRSWKAVRGELKKCSVRDVVDFLEYDIDPERWINTLLSELRSGRYEPHTPFRFTQAKSNGFSRRMTMPTIPDLVLYRTLVDYLYFRAKRFEQEQVFCERADLPANIKANKVAGKVDPMLRAIDDAVTDYETSSKKTFRAWLIYNQYRRLLVFKKVHRFIVITDITNYFDSILYNRIADSFHRIRAPHRMIGLLFFLLERLSIRDAYTESPRIGLPVDEFSCSRKLAHIVLFPHDERMVHDVGADAYVRWMDDQNFGVASRADGLKCLASVSESLARLHLSPNAKKSVILSIAEARRHFHFDLNRKLDDITDLPTGTPRERRDVAARVNEVYRAARLHEGKGQWDKILKRLYLQAARQGVRVLRRRALRDVLLGPTLIHRIADYMRSTGTVAEYLTFVDAVWSHPEQVYPDVNAALFESLLRLEPDGSDTRAIRALASRALAGHMDAAGAERCRSVAPLLILRFGDRRSLPLLRSGFTKVTEREVARACAIVYAGYGPIQATEVRMTASKLLRNHLAELVKMQDAIRGYTKLPDRWHLRAELSFNPVTETRYVDMRGLAAIRLLGQNTKAPVDAWLADKRKYLLNQRISSFDRTLIERLWPGPRTELAAVKRDSRQAAGKASRATRASVSPRAQRRNR